MLVLINLEAASQRRTAMTRQLEAKGLRYERVGVDLRGASRSDVDALCKERFPRFHFDQRFLSPAEIGCWLSHLSAWRLLVDSGESAGTVIEDDLTLAPQFADAIAGLAQRDRFDVVYLGTSSRNISARRKTAVGSLQVHEPIGIIYNTWGYSLRTTYARRFLTEGPLRIWMPIDHALGGRSRLVRPRVGVLQPAVVEEDPALGAASQIGPHTRRIDRSSLVQAVRRRLLASPASALYYSLYRYL